MTAARSRPEIGGTTMAHQVWVMVKRNLTHTKRHPEMLMDVTIQPIMFVCLFAFVFGGSIAIPGGYSYREWLLPGILVQTMAFSGFIVATGLTADIEKGVVDRFRSLPIRRSSFLVGRAVASLLHSSIGIVVMSLTGLLIGWRIRTNIVDAVIGFALLLAFGFAMIWFGVLVGSAMRSVEAVNGVMFSTIFPLTFLANTFARPEGMPTVLRVVAEWNPVSAVTQALRDRWGNGPAPLPDAAWPLHHPESATLLSALLLSVILAPFALSVFNRHTSD